MFVEINAQSNLLSTDAKSSCMVNARNKIARLKSLQEVVCVLDRREVKSSCINRREVKLFCGRREVNPRSYKEGGSDIRKQAFAR